MIFLLLGLLASPVLADPLAVHVLEDFERGNALKAWDLDVGAKVEEGQALLHFRRVSRWHPWRDPWPSLRLLYGEGLFTAGNWDDYDWLEFAVENRSALAALLKLRVDDADGTKATRLFTLPAGGRQICRVDLGLLRQEIDLDRVVLIDLYMSHPGRNYTLALDDIRLIADQVNPAAAELLADPFGGGAVRVRGKRARAALYRVEIRDDQGVPVAEHIEETERLDWTWSGGAPGRYRMFLGATDLVWNHRSDELYLGEFAVFPAARRSDLVAWSEQSTQKIMRGDLPRVGQTLYTERMIKAGGGPPLRIEMARNEVEGVQIAWRAERAVGLRLQIEQLKHEEDGAVFPPDDITLSQVGYVLTQKPDEYPVDFSGWWPDPLLPRSAFKIRRGENQVAWLALRTGKETVAGVYSGQVGIWVDGARLGAIPLELEVYDVTLPDSTTVQTAFSLYGDMLEQVYGSKRAGALRQRYVDFIVDHRINLDHLYRRETPDLEELSALAQRGRLNAFNLLYLDAEAKYDGAGLAKLASRLDPVVAQLHELGLATKAYLYGFDEVEVDDFDKMERVFAFLKARYPELRLATTARDPGLGVDQKLGKLVDIWVPLSAVYETDTAAQARLGGAEVWWYICISPQHPYANWFVEYPALEARLLWWMAHQRGIEGFLYYAMNRWPEQRAPLNADSFGRTSWNPASYGTANGDGSLFYAGADGPISSIRLENVRDGIEDYELLVMLAAKAGGHAAQALSARLVRSASDYSQDPQEFAVVRRALLQALADRP
ncbi:MAG: DUF4091 domain-containing protein [Gemmatimonadetes bacterium]|nr:DUF4091 domain-containing protein [Gemmatimonadota bacterium]MBT7419603.1 DUF4091 domain-containing protein [Gemmatimonadota bacterium]